MARRPVPAPDSFLDLPFPTAGIDVATAYSLQPGQTTPVGVNVRAFEPLTNRRRGGQRAGISKYSSARVSGVSGTVQELAVLVGAGYTPPVGTAQATDSGRVVTLIAVVAGTPYVLLSGGASWFTVNNNTGQTPPLVTSGVVRSASNNQKQWFVDGVNMASYDPTANSFDSWTASQGTLPRGPDGDRPRLVETWRGRTVLSGIESDPHNWYFSAVGDSRNFDYGPDPVVVTQAVAGNASTLGLVGDVVTCLVPFTDDNLILGGDHTIWMMKGDPMAGGQLALVSDAIGFAWGRPWCKGPDGTLFFVSNRTGIYAWKPAEGAPVRISQNVEQLLTDIDTGSSTIRLAWDDRFQGLHVFVTTTSAATATDGHFFWESRSGAWWQDRFANASQNPIATAVFDGNSPGDRRPLLGSFDGYVRFIDPGATDDDGTAIASEVLLGPILTKDLDEILLKDVQAVLGTASGGVRYAVYVGASAEAALAAGAVESGTWVAGRNRTNLVRRAGHAVWVKLSATDAWAFEALRCRVQGQGKVRRRASFGV